MGPSSTFRASCIASFLSEKMPPSYKGPCDYIGPTQVIQKNLLITSTKYNVTYSLFPELGHEYFGGPGGGGNYETYHRQ